MLMWNGTIVHDVVRCRKWWRARSVLEHLLIGFVGVGGREVPCWRSTEGLWDFAAVGLVLFFGLTLLLYAHNGIVAIFRLCRFRWCALAPEEASDSKRPAGLWLRR